MVLYCIVLSVELHVTEKYFEFCKSPTHIGALLSEEHFSQISLKSGKSTNRINSFEDAEFALKQKLKHFQSFARY